MPSNAEMGVQIAFSMKKMAEKVKKVVQKMGIKSQKLDTIKVYL